MTLVTTIQAKALDPQAVYFSANVSNEEWIAVAIEGAGQRVFDVEDDIIAHQLEGDGPMQFHLSVAQAQTLHQSLGAAIAKSQQEAAA